MENLKESLKGIKPTYKFSIISCFQFTEAAMNIHLNTAYKQNNYIKRTAIKLTALRTLCCKKNSKEKSRVSSI